MYSVLRKNNKFVSANGYTFIPQIIKEQTKDYLHYIN